MADEQKPITDAFGVERAPDTGAPVTPPAPEVKPELGADGKPKVEEKKPVAEDLENNPVVKSLRDSITKLETDKGSMGKNLSDARKIIDKAQDEIKRLKEGGKSDVKPLFEDVKRVKDLSKDEQEAMTDSEKVLFDSLADTREQMNKLVIDAGTKAAQEQEEASSKADQDAETKRINDHIDEVVQPLALKLALDDKTLANEIIANFNRFAGNDKADDTELAKRLNDAALMTPKFVAAKEQKGTTGKAVENSGAKEDPHGVDAIVEAAAGTKTGKSFTL